MRVNADSLLIRAAATSTSGTLNDLTTDLIMANNNNNRKNISTLGAAPPHGRCDQDIYQNRATCSLQRTSLLQCTKMFNIFAAAGHHQYANGAQLYCQLMKDLDTLYTNKEIY